MENTDLSKILFDEIRKIPVIDTHEHLWMNETDRSQSQNDVLSEYLIHYLSSDIISSGLSRDAFAKVTDASKDITERWKIVEPYWEFSRYTGYGRSLDIAVRDIYGIDGVNADTIEALNQKFLESKKVGQYEKVLKDLCGIETSLVDCWSFRDYDNDRFFTKVWQPTSYIIQHPNEFEHVEKNTSVKIKDLDSWLEAFETDLNTYIDTYKVNVLKTAIAYSRSLKFEKVEYSEAKALFDEVIQNRSWFPHKLQDFMMHYILKCANERHMTFQFHTGLLEGNGNTLTNSDPSLLTNLFFDYPNVSFDLFHISYPYHGTASALAKMFPNVFIDMCWAHIISPSASMSALDDFLDAVPYNKISAFGGDYCFIDGVYGHLYISRQNVSRVLAKKVSDGIFTESKAVQIAKALYYDNPKRIFKI